MYKFIFTLVLIFLVSFSVFCQNETLTAVEVTEGEYAGYQMLKGYQGEELFRVYFKVEYKGSIISYVVTHENLKEVDMDEVITFEYRGEKRQSTRRQLYELFNTASSLWSYKRSYEEWVDEDTEFSPAWLEKTFGEVYQDWFNDQLYSQEASRLVNKYLSQNQPEPLVDRFTTSEITIIE